MCFSYFFCYIFKFYFEDVFDYSCDKNVIQHIVSGSNDHPCQQIRINHCFWQWSSSVQFSSDTRTIQQKNSTQKNTEENIKLQSNITCDTRNQQVNNNSNNNNQSINPINQSINLYFRHMAHKKQRRQTGNIYNRYTYIKPSPKNAKKCQQ